MKKSLFLFIIISIIVFIASCTDDEPTGPLPVISFSQDKNFTVVDDVITFTNSTTDGATFEWDFGDGNSATTENTSHTYDETGIYTVTLTATGTGGLQSTGTTTITVGVRTLIGIDLVAINPINTETGKAWDEDETEPDILFVLGEDQAESSLTFFDFGLDLDQSTLPISASLNENNFIAFSNTNWVFLLLDNDVPFDESESTELMIGFVLNPVNQGTINSQTGSGFIPLTSADGLYDITLRFQIR